MDIQFTNEWTWDIDRDSMVFIAKVDSRRAVCLVTREALEDHFGGDKTPRAADAFEPNRASIYSIAEHMIRGGVFASSGEIIIRSEDVPR